MSFRTAYYDANRGRWRLRSLAPFRDPTPEEWKKTMDEYYKQQNQNRYNGRTGR